MRHRHDAKAATASTRGPAFTPGCIEPISVLTGRRNVPSCAGSTRPNSDPVFSHPGSLTKSMLRNALQILPKRAGPAPQGPAKTYPSCIALNGYNDVAARVMPRTGLEMTSDVTAARHRPIPPTPIPPAASAIFPTKPVCKSSHNEQEAPMDYASRAWALGSADRNISGLIASAFTATANTRSRIGFDH